MAIFINDLAHVKPPEPSGGDAIVVLTGGSLRLDEGLALLSAGKGKKLFVSGVHRGVDVKQLLRLSRQSPDALDCCVILGYAADNTEGNARETAIWIKSENYRSLLLVTANYHMPRSLLEFHQTMPNLQIIPYPVVPPNVPLDDWWVKPKTAILLAGEFNKYIYAWLRFRLQTSLFK